MCREFRGRVDNPSDQNEGKRTSRKILTFISEKGWYFSHFLLNIMLDIVDNVITILICTYICKYIKTIIVQIYITLQYFVERKKKAHRYLITYRIFARNIDGLGLTRR